MITIRLTTAVRASVSVSPANRIWLKKIPKPPNTMNPATRKVRCTSTPVRSGYDGARGGRIINPVSFGSKTTISPSRIAVVMFTHST